MGRRRPPLLPNESANEKLQFAYQGVLFRRGKRRRRLLGLPPPDCYQGKERGEIGLDVKKGTLLGGGEGMLAKRPIEGEKHSLLLFCCSF